MSVEVKKEFQSQGGCAKARARNESPRSHADFELLGPIVSFSVGSYGRLNKKCRHKQISNSQSLLLQKGHFQSGLM